MFGAFFFIAFLIGVGLPAWWLGYLALLARPAADNPDQTEWYPAGRLVVWCALASALVVIIAIPNFGTDEDSFRAGLRNSFERVLRTQTRTPADAPLEIRGVDVKRVVEFLAEVVPFAAAVLATITNAINLWLAGRIVKVSGQSAAALARSAERSGFRLMRRPRLPSRSAARSFPAWSAASAGIFSAALLMAYAILGFAVLHAMTRGIAGRGFILGGSYAAVFVFGWPILLMTPDRACRHRIRYSRTRRQQERSARFAARDEQHDSYAIEGEQTWK